MKQDLDDDYEIKEFVCPFCGNIEYMKILEKNEKTIAVKEQKCEECDEPFDLKTWIDIEDYNNFDDKEEDENDDKTYRKHGFFFEEDIIIDGDDDTEDGDYSS